jgi:hypothetical protein
LVIKYFSTQGRPDPMGGLYCFLCSNKTWTPPLGASDTLIIVKKWIKNEKVTTPNSKGG